MAEFNKNYDPEKLREILEGKNYISPIAIQSCQLLDRL